MSATPRHNKGIVWGTGVSSQRPLASGVFLPAPAFADLTGPRLRGGIDGSSAESSLAGSDSLALLEQCHAVGASETFMEQAAVEVNV